MKQSMCRSDVFRLIHGRDFWISIAGTVAIVLFSNLSEIPETLEFVAVDYLMDNFLYWGWYRNLLFVVAAYPFARSYCQDMAHGFRDTAVQRTGVFRYAWSKAWCTAASAFFVTFFGLFVSAGVFWLFCEPCYYEAYGEMNYTYPYGMLAAGGNTMLYLAVRFLLFSLGAALWSMFALLVSTWKREPLVILMTPFIASYLESRFQFFLPMCVQIDACTSGGEMIEAGIAGNFLYGVCYLLFLIVLLGVLFFYQVKRRVYGEIR